MEMYLFYITLAAMSNCILSRQSCSIFRCETKLTLQHAVEISMIPEFSITDGQCQRRMLQIDVSATFCPEDFFCGLDLNPDFTGTKGLAFNQSASCYVYTKTKHECDVMSDELAKKG